MQSENTARQKTCKELIPEKYHREMDSIKEALDHGHREDNQVGTDVQTYDEYQDNILGINVKIEMDIQCSWGGPSDGFKLSVNPEDGEIESAEYYYRDWFDGATQKVSDDDLEYIKRMFGSMVENEIARLSHAN